MKKTIWFIRILIVLLFAFLLYYLTLPAINLQNPGFYIYLFMVLACYIGTSILSLLDGGRIINKIRDLPRNLLIVYQVLLYLHSLLILYVVHFLTLNLGLVE